MVASHHQKYPITITHVAFVDDIILFCQGIDNSLQEIMHILQTCSAALGQQISFSK